MADRRFGSTFRTEPTDEAGLVLEDDDVVYIVEPDGTRVPAGGGGGSQPGVAIVRKFPFAYNTPNILTGHAVYTPTVGDALLAAFIDVTTPFDGDSGAKATIGAFSPPTIDARGLFLTSPGLQAAAVPPVAHSAPQYQPTLPAPNQAPWSTPWLTLAATPVQVLVSINGRGPQLGYALSQGSEPSLPFDVVAGVSDEFVFNGLTYTVAPQTISTGAELWAAMNAALHGGVRLDTILVVGARPSSSPDSFDPLDGDATTVAASAALNGAVFAPGANDFLVNTDWNGSEAIAGGQADGGDPGSTQGAATLYLVTATPT